jgi:hypothetical protein
MVVMRCRPLLIVAPLTMLFALLAPAPGFAATPTDPSGDGSGAAATTTTVDNSFLDTKRNLTDCLNNSIDLPDCGVEPKTAGARGGWLQGVTFGVLALGIAFIFWRVARAVKARDRALGSQIP